MWSPPSKSDESIFSPRRRNDLNSSTSAAGTAHRDLSETLRGLVDLNLPLRRTDGAVPSVETRFTPTAREASLSAINTMRSAPCVPSTTGSTGPMGTSSVLPVPSTSDSLRQAYLLEQSIHRQQIFANLVASQTTHSDLPTGLSRDSRDALMQVHQLQPPNLSVGVARYVALHALNRQRPPPHGDERAPRPTDDAVHPLPQ